MLMSVLKMEEYRSLTDKDLSQIIRSENEVNLYYKRIFDIVFSLASFHWR